MTLAAAEELAAGAATRRCREAALVRALDDELATVPGRRPTRARGCHTAGAGGVSMPTPPHTLEET
ncbi:hypothetical protein [Geodermatophilus marinus]|uniref:hypothetical protein n=1 Tax=Geodermatophilus sp. LHW52908 TaxID=2303986 RepID=UPI000E3CA11C|nr:hypothetical protein [Geodermatophilus sp. LHW52908]RFU22925.1 hypothetical protein D0Z06_03480 [Geodermatophilus sp. LHW52908]